MVIKPTMHFQSLANFYTSDVWKDFRRQLINERTQADGFVHDELTGEPIRNAYDIIAHHKIELTLQNVNDVEVSLNPDNIMLVSMRSHNEIHERFGYAQGKKVYLVYGPPCSGKNTYVDNVKKNADLIVDIDAIWFAITGKKYLKPDALKTCAFGLYQSLYDMARTRQGKWQRAYVIQGAAHKGNRERTINELGAESVFIDADKESCLQRLSVDPYRDKTKWTQFIEDWFRIYQP